MLYILHGSGKKKFETNQYINGCRNIIGGTFSEFNEWGIDPESLSVFESDSSDFNVIVYPVPTSDFINVLNPDGILSV